MKTANSTSATWYQIINKLEVLCFMGILYLTNRFHVAMHLFSNRSQKTSKCSKNISDTLSYRLACHFFDFICNLLLNRWQHGIYMLKCYTESEQMSYCTYQHSLGRPRFAKYRFSNLYILHFCCFIPYLGSNLITASSLIYEKCWRIRRDKLHNYSPSLRGATMVNKIPWDTCVIALIFGVFKTEF